MHPDCPVIAQSNVKMFLNKSRKIQASCFNWAKLVSDSMVKIGLQLKAFLENCTGLTPEGEDFRLARGGLSNLEEV